MHVLYINCLLNRLLWFIYNLNINPLFCNVFYAILTVSEQCTYCVRNGAERLKVQAKLAGQRNGTTMLDVLTSVHNLRGNPHQRRRTRQKPTIRREDTSLHTVE